MKAENAYIQIYLFIKLLGYMMIYFHLPDRQTEGVVRAHQIRSAYTTNSNIPYLHSF